jgi:hypothetical protein
MASTVLKYCLGCGGELIVPASGRGHGLARKRCERCARVETRRQRTQWMWESRRRSRS